MMRLALAALALIASQGAEAGEPAGLHAALSKLTSEGKFSGAVVVLGVEGVRFARGYGLADPFTGRRFTPDTPVDSASLAKPVTAAAVLLLAREGKLDLDGPVRHYLPGYPHAGTTVRHLLAHSAGLAFDNSPAALAGKTNAALLAGAGGRPPLFRPGSAFDYCNLCYTTLALLIEQVSGRPYLDFVRDRVLLPRGVTLRPRKLAEWTGRAIGYRRGADGKIERADSYEDEAFYGTANFSLSAAQLAEWGASWWAPSLAGIRGPATTVASIAGKPSGLTLGNWYCAPRSRRCHYLGHHEGFHHMLYWDRDRRISVAMISNNTLAPGLQQRLQRALVYFARGRAAEAERELERPLADLPIASGKYRAGADMVEVTAGSLPVVHRAGLTYRAFPIGSGIHYAPGLDIYLGGTRGGEIRLLGLHEEILAVRE